MAINFRGRTNVKYCMQTQLLAFYKDTAKVSSLPLLKKLLNQHIFSLRRKKYQYCVLNFKQIKYKRSENLTSKHREVLQIAKTFSEIVNKEAT